jgi:hypothetical protein
MIVKCAAEALILRRFYFELEPLAPNIAAHWGL